ncbi:MAG: hypothetical protein KatS3mg002_1414 [Candidatus Woesearchaeota archaeon]|nr:MAG: hypothetical protein KatS3mg002_1414 [Candidatus Woesearchaeota archaeon]
MTVRVILDTNFLMIPAQKKIDIFEEIKKILNTPYQLYIFTGTIEELKKISSGKGKESINARVTLQLIKQKNLKTLKDSIGEIHVDKVILDNVNDSDIVCTQDKALKRLLKIKYPKIKIITLNRKLIIT